MCQRQKLFVSRPAKALPGKFSSKRTVRSEGEVARAVSFLKPALKIECARVALQLKLHVRAVTTSPVRASVRLVGRGLCRTRCCYS